MPDHLAIVWIMVAKSYLTALVAGTAAVAALAGCASSHGSPSYQTSFSVPLKPTPSAAGPAPSWTQPKEQSEFAQLIGPTTKALARYTSIAKTGSAKTIAAAAKAVQNAADVALPPLTYGLWDDGAANVMSNLQLAMVYEAQLFGQIANASTSKQMRSIFSGGSITNAAYVNLVAAARTAIGLPAK
jgi:hypothetical protein